LADTFRAVRKAIQGRSYRGLYEVLECESTLELRDRKGNRATLKKREKVRYLQDNVVAYQDQTWGDGEILLHCRCTPGIPGDRHRSGYKTYILISRREVKDKGDVDEFNIEWGIRQGFLRRAEQWETHVTHRTERLKINVVFPRPRPPRHAVLVEGNRQRSHDRYGLTMQPGAEELLVGLLMVDRPRPADPEWLAEVEATFEEYELVAMTPTGERGIACRMRIEPESLPHLRRSPGEKGASTRAAVVSLRLSSVQAIRSVAYPSAGSGRHSTDVNARLARRQPRYRRRCSRCL
jgi:hypothetical protein